MKRALAIAGVVLMLQGCASGGGTPPPRPTPAPTPVPTPKPTPDPVPIACENLESFKLEVKVEARRKVDATPGHGFVGSNFKPLGPEGSDARRACEERAGPYTFSLDRGDDAGFVECQGAGNCDPNKALPNCFPLDGNPLFYVICHPGRVKVVGGNGASASINVP